MFHRNASKLRLRPRRWLTTVSEPAIYRRLTDRTHRSAYASMERETTVHRKQNAEIKLKPSIAHMLLWLRRKQERKLCETTLNPQGLPSSFKEAAVTEVILFHMLTCLNSGAADEHWLDCQSAQLTFLHSQLQKRKSPRELSQTLTLDNAFDLARALEASISEKQASVIFKSLACMALACPRIRDHRMLVPWIRSLSAPRITEACAELANLTYIPACVTSDILLRTPLSIDETALQLDLWHTFIEPIAQDSHEKRAYVANIIENLLFYTVQFDPRRLEHFLSFTLSKLTSTRSGFHFKVMTHEFVNALIYLLALTFIKNGSSSSSPMPIIKAQKVLVEFLGHDKLNQKGYVGIALLISHESREKATRLLKITKSHFPDHSDLIHITSIYLSNTPEELLHHFNLAIVQYPHSATMWLMLAKKLQQLQLLTEVRSQKLLSELLARKNDIVISKDIILLLLSPIESINGIEDFIHALEKSGLFVKYQNVVLNKYMALLYRYSDERSVHKPYLDKHIRHSSNIECARFLYQKIKWKTISSIGVMLNGEVNHRPGDLYELYCSELQGNIPDEACLGALLRASTKRADGQPYTWGRLYAPQVAVHEFKKYVSNGKDANAVAIFASNKLWQVYIHALRSADYTAELAEIMRWWERSSFIPSRSTLMLLLRALPIEFSERHIKHAHSLPRTSRSWPWPTIEDFKG
ncbi:hypothetical protein OXX80_001327 [Metschnikowia pulcherrima]